MLYMLCEDEKMGFRFWNLVNSLLLDGKAHIYTSEGISKMPDKIDTLPLKSGDTLFCLMDNVGNKDCYKVLNKLNVKSCEKGYFYIVSNYYCIEEVFLSFNYLCNWLNVSDMTILNICQYIHNYIYNRYILTDDKSYFNLDILRGMFPNSTTTEQLAKSFLTDISRRYRGGFHLSEKRIGRCWSCNCKETKGFPRYCMANDCCLLPNENGQLDYLLYSKGKLEFIWNNSILVNSPHTINKLKALC